MGQSKGGQNLAGSPATTSVYDMSAGNMSAANNMFDFAASGFAANPMLSAATYSTPKMGAARYSTPLMEAASYDPTTMGPVGAIGSRMDQYYNPYTSEVIDRSAFDMQRNNQIQQQNIAARAAQAGAFGGSRHGLVEAETNAETNRAIGDMSAGLRNNMFNIAAELGGRDISNEMLIDQFNANANNAAGQFNAGNQQQANANNQNARADARRFNATAQMTADANNQGAIENARQFNANSINNMAVTNENNRLAGMSGLLSAASGMAGLGQQNFNIGRTIGADQLAQGGLLQGMDQLLLDDARGMFNDYINAPLNALAIRNSTASGSPMNQNQTTTGSRQPGLFDYLGLGLQGLNVAFPAGV